MYVYSVTVLTMGALVPGTWEERSRFMVSDLRRLPSGRGISSWSVLPLLPSRDGDAQRVLSASRDEGLQLPASFSACRVALPCPGCGSCPREAAVSLAEGTSPGT